MKAPFLRDVDMSC